MTDVYRTASYLCPSCPGAPLREFNKRLVCDECDGILIGDEDFTSACEDLTGEEMALVRFDEKPTTIGCPRCERALTSCRVKIGKKKLRSTFLHCERDGLWCGTGVLAGAFAVVSRKLVTSSRPGAPINRTGMDLGPSRGGGGLQISAWHQRPRRRATTVTPINVHADRTLTCPHCTSGALTFVGDRYACATCEGAFVETSALEAMVGEMTHAPWQVPAASGQVGTRLCPVCAEAMSVERFESVEIDRCAAHGMWFDATELAATLVHASDVPTGIGGWLRRLFV